MYAMPWAEFAEKGILTKEEADYAETLHIPGNDGISGWLKKYSIDEKCLEAVKAGLVPECEKADKRDAGVHVISDSMGVHGIQSQADGKYYDSKSQYRKSLKAHGMVEMGTDAPTKANTELRGDFSNLKRDISKAYDQVVGV